ncbi:MAG: hypothetical protein EXS05_11060 [Planctomycetaceae bacterium]|nr:hypothetical protein [Planctomycetaceae bacterium]
MLKKIVLSAVTAVVTVLVAHSEVHAYGACHAGATHVSSNGVSHVGATSGGAHGEAYHGGSSAAYHGEAAHVGYGATGAAYGTAAVAATGVPNTAYVYAPSHAAAHVAVR